MFGKNNRIIFFVFLALIALLVAGYFLSRRPSLGVQPVVTNEESEKAEIRAAVARFAEELKTVPLGAADDVLRKAIEDNYGPLISVDLLAAWQKEPHKAPGKLAGSSAPEGIKIVVLDRDPDDGSYTAEGDVLSGSVVQYQVAMKFRKSGDGRWLMTGFVGAIPGR